MDSLIVLGAILLVVLALLAWALFFRKNARRPGIRSHRHRRRTGRREEFQKGAAGIKELIQQHQRRRQREHRPVNPTLAETGGLPPIREKEPPPPSPT